MEQNLSQRRQITTVTLPASTLSTLPSLKKKIRENETENIMEQDNDVEIPPGTPSYLITCYKRKKQLLETTGRYAKKYTYEEFQNDINHTPNAFSSRYLVEEREGEREGEGEGKGKKERLSLSSSSQKKIFDAISKTPTGLPSSSLSMCNPTSNRSITPHLQTSRSPNNLVSSEDVPTYSTIVSNSSVLSSSATRTYKQTNENNPNWQHQHAVGRVSIREQVMQELEKMELEALKQIQNAHTLKDTNYILKSSASSVSSNFTCMQSPINVMDQSKRTQLSFSPSSSSNNTFKHISRNKVTISPGQICPTIEKAQVEEYKRDQASIKWRPYSKILWLGVILSLLMLLFMVYIWKDNLPFVNHNSGYWLRPQKFQTWEYVQLEASLSEMCLLATGI